MEGLELLLRVCEDREMDNRKESLREADEYNHNEYYYHLGKARAYSEMVQAITNIKGRGI